MSSEAAIAIDAARKSFEASRNELEQELSDLREAIATLEAENATMITDITRMRLEREPIDARVRELAEIRGRLEAKLEAAEAGAARMTSEIADCRARNERRETELTQLRTLNLELVEARAGMDATWSQTEVRNNELEQQHVGLLARIERAEARSDQAEARADGLREEVDGRNADIAALRDQIIASSGRHQAEVATLKERFRELERQAAGWKKRAESGGIRATPSAPASAASAQSSQGRQ